MDNLKTQETVSYDKNKQEVIVRSKRKRIMGPFSAIGPLSTVDSQSEDLLDMLGQVSNGAFKLFLELKKRR